MLLALTTAVFHLLLTAQPTAGERTSFIRIQQCPISDATAVRLDNEMQCSFHCARQPSCNAFHFDPLTSLCYHGDACSTAAQWTTGDCVSYEYSDSGTSGSSPCDSFDIPRQLGMKFFYNFKKTGLTNVANPRTFCLTAHDAALGSDGVSFKGNSGSYLSTPTPGFDKLLDYGTFHSAFVQARHIMNDSLQIYHSYQQCSGMHSGNLFGSYAKAEFITARRISGLKTRHRALTSAILPGDANQHLLSTGLTFNGTAHSFYLNGSVFPAAIEWQDSPSGATPVANWFQCLRLGCTYSSSICFVGTMQCYGMAARVLTTAEFKLLEEYCLLG